MPAPRPVSPFLVLLLGGAATALTAEWLRFQWSLAVAAAPAALGAVATVTGVARAYRSRRTWRRGAQASTGVAGTRADASAPSALIDTDDDGGLRIRRLDPSADTHAMPAGVAAHEPAAPLRRAAPTKGPATVPPASDAATAPEGGTASRGRGDAPAPTRAGAERAATNAPARSEDEAVGSGPSARARSADASRR